MKTHHFLFGVALVAGLFISTSPASAYFTTAQSAQTLSATTTLFTITYTFGSPKNDMSLPILVGRDLASAKNDKLGFTILDAAGSSTNVGTANGIVLSHATIKDGRYFIPAGSSATFTFVTLLTTPATAQPTPHKVRVSALPFTEYNRGKATESHLNPSELIYYTTPLSLLMKGKIGAVSPSQGISVVYTTK